MSFDVIGRRECILQLLTLPDVLKSIVDSYVYYDIVAAYSIPRPPCNVYALIGRDSYYARGGKWYWFYDGIETLIQASFEVYRIVPIAGTILALCGSIYSLEIRDVSDNFIFLQTYGRQAVVCLTKVYFIGNDTNIWSYDVTTAELQQLTSHKNVKHLYGWHTTVSYQTLDTKYFVLHETQPLNIEGECVGVMDDGSRRYFVCEDRICCEGLEPICLEDIVWMHATDGYMFVNCNLYDCIVDLKRWQFMKVDRELIAIKNAVIRYHDTYIDVFQ